jgi:hypothetical protein
MNSRQVAPWKLVRTVSPARRRHIGSDLKQKPHANVGICGVHDL